MVRTTSSAADVFEIHADQQGEQSVVRLVV
jgi:hypothetical protein